MEILICIILAFINSLLAQRKGQNRLAWAVITVAAFIIMEVIGGLLLILLFYRGSFTIEGLSNFMYTPAHSFFTLFCGVGGYLIARRILERMPDVNNKQ